MDMAKSFFGRDHEGYVGKRDHAVSAGEISRRNVLNTHSIIDFLTKIFSSIWFQRTIETAGMDDEDNDVVDGINGIQINESIRPAQGGPFSALIPSMWPQDILAKLGQPEVKFGFFFSLQSSRKTNALTFQADGADPPDYRFDEFGFRVEEEDGPEQSSNKLLGEPFIEDENQRLQWISHLEFSHSKEATDLTWDTVDIVLPRTEKLKNLVRAGIPHSLRPQMWMRMSGALQKKMNSETSYKEIIKASSNDALMTSKQIEKDLLRILPTNACFSSPNGTGIPRLRRILRGLAWLFPDIGYCQGTGVIAASLLLYLEEEDAFWMMATIVEDLLPASYYSSTLLGIQADQRVMQTLISNYLTVVDDALKNHDIELSLITLHWFLTLFANVVHMKILLR